MEGALESATGCRPSVHTLMSCPGVLTLHTVLRSELSLTPFLLLPFVRTVACGVAWRKYLDRANRGCVAGMFTCLWKYNASGIHNHLFSFPSRSLWTKRRREITMGCSRARKQHVGAPGYERRPSIRFQFPCFALLLEDRRCVEEEQVAPTSRPIQLLHPSRRSCSRAS